MKRSIVCLAALALCVALTAPLFAAGPKKIAVFVPGVMAGSPLYADMATGAQKAKADYPDLIVKVVEGGFNQAEWGEKIMSLAATGEYDFIMSSNPSMPFASLEAAKAFPKQKFIVVDAYLSGNPQFYTLLYNQVEQAYMAGYLAALVSKSSMKGANKDLKIGMIVAQEYPALVKMMKPGYEQGAKAVDPGFTVDYRIIGNWYDANKAADLANSMMDGGVDVILGIAGGAGQGIIKAAQARGKYMVYFDSNEYKIAPGTIVGCALLAQERAVYETVKKALDGKIPFGKADTVYAKDGYIDFADKDPLYTKNVPADVRSKMDAMMKKMRSGALKLEIPQL